MKSSLQIINDVVSDMPLNAALEDTGRPKVLAIDLDGTICAYSSDKSIKDKYPDPGTPYDGIIDFLKRLKSLGWLIIIWTCRQDTKELRDILNRYGVVYDHINYNPYQPPNSSNKIYADVYLDDRAIQFGGSIDDLFNKVINFSK